MTALALVGGALASIDSTPAHQGFDGRCAALGGAAGPRSKVVTAYVNACTDGERLHLESTLTDDATVELPLAEPGAYFVADRATAAKYCNTTGASTPISSLRIYPADGHSLFASFNQGSHAQRLLFIEMRGSRIMRLRDFTGTPPAAFSEAARRTSMHRYVH